MRTGLVELGVPGLASENKAEYRIKGLTMGRRSGAQNHKSQATLLT